MPDDDGTCPADVRIDSWHHVRCGKPIKRDGKCGVHAAAEDKRRKNEAGRNAEKRQSELAREGAQVIVELLASRGITATPYRHRPLGPGSPRYTGGVVIDADSVELLVTELGLVDPS